ncbi:transmembrane and coiled-coil domain-containing protein 4-like protein [Tanacetum coccineum]|uniref:Transmembrane and coiled-coil domain-containing protein 4-like protein n=1 Tax=Tanacetum coccineum TaxID=301880 RepID=A0ABQ5GHQ1_9ASTR
MEVLLILLQSLPIDAAAGAVLTGIKMARRTGSVDELAVEILVLGFVFKERDLLRPWEGQTDNMERYALQWEYEHLYAVSTAIQDWLSSTLAMELMRRGAMMTVLSGFLSAFACSNEQPFVDGSERYKIDPLVMLP